MPESDLHPGRTDFVLQIQRAWPLKFWILALGAAAVAARVTYSLMNRAARAGRFTHDQVSNDWLMTARIHEDQG